MVCPPLLTTARAGLVTMLPDERCPAPGDCSPHQRLLLGGCDAVTVWIDPETPLPPPCKREVIAIAVKGVPLDEQAFQAVLASSGSGDEF